MAQDTRTSVFGNFHVVTGTYTAGGGTIDVSDHFSEILSCTARASGGAPSAANLPRIGVNATTLVVTLTSADASQVGRWMAIGHRG